MDLSASNFRGARAFIALLSLTMGAGALQATNLLNPTAAVSVTCNTATGPGAAASITVKPATSLTGSNTITVSYVAPTGGLTVTSPATTVLSTTNQTAGIIFSVNVAAGCAGASTGPETLQFKAASNSGSAATDATTTVTETITETASGLSVAPAAVTVTCSYTSANGGTYTPGSPQTVSVTSMATGGTPYTLDTTNDGNGPPSWLVVNPTTPTGTAGATPQAFTIAAASGCNGYALNSSHTVTLHLLNPPAPDKLFTVTLQIVPPSPLTVTPVPAAANIALSYIKGSGTTANANVSVTSTVSGAYVSINTASLPSWLTVDNASGTAPWSLRFSTTSSTNSLAPGTYTATVLFDVSGYFPLAVPVTLQVNNAAPALSVNATSVPLNWTIGTSPPTVTVVATSSDSPIQYTITTGGTLAPVVSAAEQSGLAYSFGTDIAVSFGSSAFASAQPGAVLTGTLTFTWGSPASTTVVTFLVTVVSPGATLTGISPASLPTATPGTPFTLNLTGTGFVGGTNPALATRIGIVSGNTIIADTNLSINVINPSNMTLTIVVPSVADANLPFSPTGSGGTVYLGIVNGNTSNIPTGQAQFTIGIGPIIQGATSSSSFTEVTPPTLPTFAPYDMVSLWGANFCSSAGTGCSSTQILAGSPDALTLRYPTTLGLPAPDTTGRVVSVSFYQHNTTTLIGTAPLLFATNSQINLIVPGAVANFTGSETVDIVANFGTGTTVLHSAAFPINIAVSDPGIFTVGSDGEGSGAILSASYSLITSSNPAGMRSNGTDSDTVQIYVTGLGAPTSNGDNSTAGTGLIPTDCIGATSSAGESYMASLQAATAVSPALTNIDGAVIQSALLNTGNFPPCFTPSAVAVTIGGVAANVTYAAFVADTVAGLYQINAQLPSSTAGPFYQNYPSTATSLAGVTAPVQLPVQVTINSVSSQNGVTMWVTPRLLVNASGLSSGVLNATVGINATTTVTATEGTPNYQYSLTSGLLPTGMALVSSTGVISGKPGPNTAGSYTVTITATDSATTPVTGKVTFTIVVAGGLYMTTTGTVPQTVTYGTAIAPITIAATGGTYPYTYALSLAGTGTPTGMAIGAHTGILTTTTTLPAGTYNVTVTATDSSGTPLTGSANFDIVVGLNVTETAGTGSTLAVVSATGNSGPVNYQLDSASQAAGLAIDSSGNLTAGGATSNTYPVTVTVTDTVLPPGASAEGTGSVGPFNVTF